jgi:hypothetical protein
LFSAIPVTIPGSAIGRITNSEMASRPKNRYRCKANAAAVPRTRLIAVAASPARTLVASAARAPALSAVVSHQRSVQPEGGQANVASALNELRTTTTNGT